jgi:type I restriction enzyme S subunit
VREYLREVNHGQTRDGINTRQLLELPVVLPYVDEQDRIVAEIEKQFTRLDALGADLERLRLLSLSYRRSVLVAAFVGRLQCAVACRNDATDLAAAILKSRQDDWERAEGANGRRYVAPPSPSSFLPVPTHWRVLTLQQITSELRPICYGILMPKEDVVEGVKYVRVVDIGEKGIKLEQIRRTATTIAEKYKRASLRDGDLLVSIRGSYGRVAQVPAELDGGNITQDTARLAVTEFMAKRFVYHYLRSPLAQNYFKRVARGVAVRGVNIGDLRLLPVPVAPIDEQQAIADEIDRRLSVADALIEAIDATQSHANRLRQSLLTTVFSGRPRVDGQHVAVERT